MGRSVSKNPHYILKYALRCCQIHCSNWVHCTAFFHSVDICVQYTAYILYTLHSFLFCGRNIRLSSPSWLCINIFACRSRAITPHMILLFPPWSIQFNLMQHVSLCRDVVNVLSTCGLKVTLGQLPITCSALNCTASEGSWARVWEWG